MIAIFTKQDTTVNMQLIFELFSYCFSWEDRAQQILSKHTSTLLFLLVFCVLFLCAFYLCVFCLFVFVLCVCVFYMGVVQVNVLARFYPGRAKENSPPSVGSNVNQVAMRLCLIANSWFEERKAAYPKGWSKPFLNVTI